MNKHITVAVLLLTATFVIDNFAKKHCPPPSECSGNIQTFRIHDNGSLTPLQCTNAGTDPVSVAASPDGKFVVVANAGSHDITVFSINANTGLLKKIQTIPSEINTVEADAQNPELIVAQPTAIVYSKNGALAAVANAATNTITLYGVTISGFLAFLQTVSSGGINPVSLDFSFNGQALAVANTGSGSDVGNLAVFPIANSTLGIPVTCIPMDNINLVAYQTANALTVSSSFENHIKVLKVNLNNTVDCTAIQDENVTNVRSVTYSPTTNQGAIVSGSSSNLITPVTFSPSNGSLTISPTSVVGTGPISSVSLAQTTACSGTVVLSTSLSSPNLSATVQSGCMTSTNFVPVSINVISSDPTGSAASAGVHVVAKKAP